MSIHMIAFDLDGTLLNDAKELAPATITILQQLAARDVQLVLCTGRPINAIWRYLALLELTGVNNYVVTFNGALVQQVATKKILAQHSLTKQSLTPLVAFAQQVNWPLDVLDFEQVYPLTELAPSLYQQMNPNLKFIPQTFTSLPNDLNYSKAVVAADHERLVQGQLQLPAQLATTFNVASSRTNLLEFSPTTVTKATALDVLLQRFGWQRANLMAFGDQLNDLSMLQAAGVGVAMSNGVPEIKAAAERITTVNNDQDGVARFLQDYFNL
ncbi:Cof-type HAD-IIB family hydrolase [Loigolactobacillus zhaoyuanensis]|uniref:Cof-type HAD-IIB family hydrolase n=1 Tax=Loigolactobacillus zhaoyuanensis TaxID=2486017 RepID=UPI000F7458C7|nr:Cof-type HAD-IIB family hydrolase [Loigolactobacillus zhaoyuanensis]